MCVGTCPWLEVCLMTPPEVCWAESSRLKLRLVFVGSRIRSAAQVLYVHVGSEPLVIGQIPAGVVGILVDHDVVAVPVPAIDVGVVPGCNAPVEVIEPETVWAAAAKMPDMLRAESAGEVPVLVGSIHVVVGIVAAGIVTDPAAAIVDVGCVGMSFVVAEAAIIMLARLAVVRFGTALGWAFRGAHGRSAARLGCPGMFVAVILGDQGNRERKRGRGECKSKGFHEFSFRPAVDAVEER